MNRVILFIAAFIVAFFVAFSPVSVYAEENEINLIEISSDVWAQMSSSDKDTLFRYAVNRCGGLTYGSTMEISDVYKLQYYNGMVHHLLHPEDPDTSTFISLELLGIVDFKHGYYKSVHSTVSNVTNRDVTKIGTRPNLGIYYGTLADGTKYQILLSRFDNGLLMPSVKYTYPNGATESIFYGGGFYPDDKRNYFKPEFYTVGNKLYFKTNIFGYQNGEIVEVFDQSFPVGDVSSSSGDIEFDDTLPFEDPDNIVDPSDPSDPDYGDDLYVNENLLDILNKIYQCEVKDLSDQQEMLSALYMINSTLENLDKNNTDNTELIAVLLALQTAIEALKNGGSSSSDVGDQLTTIIDNTSNANNFYYDIVNNSNLGNEYLKKLTAISNDTDTVKKLYSSFQKQLFDSKFKFVSSLKNIIDTALSAYSSSSVSSIDFSLNSFSYSIDFNDYFADSIDTVRYMLAAFIYVSFAFNTYRRIPSYLYNGGDR